MDNGNFSLNALNAELNINFRLLQKLKNERERIQNEYLNGNKDAIKKLKKIEKCLKKM